MTGIRARRQDEEWRTSSLWPRGRQAIAFWPRPSRFPACDLRARARTTAPVARIEAVIGGGASVRLRHDAQVGPRRLPALRIRLLAVLLPDPAPNANVLP